MKKTFLILVGLIAWLCLIESETNAQTDTTKAQTVEFAKEPCTECDKLNTQGKHKIGRRKVKKYVNEFNKRFPHALSYGGTIYGDLAYFNSIPGPTPNDYPVIRYHFCLDQTDHNKLYLAFEKAVCVLKSDKYYFEYIDPGDCRVSIDLQFPKVPPVSGVIESFPDRCRRQQVHRSNPSNRTKQKVVAADVKRDRDNLNSLDNIYEAYLNCSFKGGNFNFNNSIKAIFDANTNCAGIRYYFGYDKNLEGTSNEIRVILVGVKRNGQNLKIWKENSLPGK